MISIIICSINNKRFLQLEENIIESIGEITYEIIKIDNSIKNKSITSVYNLGISKSRYEYLLFIHEDILFHTKCWGKELIDIFDNNLDLGLIGIAGASIKTKLPSGWWDCKEEFKSINIIQHLSNNKIEEQNIGFEKSSLNEVVVIDGVFMAMRKKVNVFFDKRIEGFHGYDFNIAFEVQKKGYKIGVTNKILIEHFSLGNLNSSWLDSIVHIHNVYDSLLPLSLNKEINKRENEIFSCKSLINHCLTKGNKVLFFKYWFRLIILKPNSKMHKNLVFYLLKKIIK
jgi:hypothetical protein